MPFHNTKIRKQMEKIYRQVSVKERLPEKAGRYFTSFGECTFSTNTRKWLFMLENSTNYVDWWLEEVELPSEEDINWKYPLNSNELHKTTLNVGCRTGANYILKTLKGEKR